MRIDLAGIRTTSRSWRNVGIIAVVANALALLCFRHFVSLDGPMHLLHAAVQKDAWLGITRQAEGMWVDAGALDLNLGDLLLTGLSGVVHPFVLHKLLAVVAVTSVCSGAWRLARAYGTAVNTAWVLVLPFSFGFVLILGLFHFMIGTGLALWVCGWWVSRPVIRWKELGLLVLGCALGTFTHKTSGALVLLLTGVHEVVFHFSDRTAWRARWSALPRLMVPTLASFCLLIAIVVLAMRFSTSPVHPHEAHHPVRELLTLRSMLLIDSVNEQPYRIALGAAIVALLGMAAYSRHRLVLRRADALLISAVVLTLFSFIRTPMTELLYITDRAQWLALLMTACWLSVQALPGRALRYMAIGIVAMHALRLVYFEHRMADLRPRDEAVLLAGRAFGPGALVVPAVLDTEDWLARHRTAYAAIAHRGLVFTGRDHLRITWTTPPEQPVRGYLLSPESDWRWIGTHINKGVPPTLRQVLVIGAPVDGENPHWDELKAVLKEHYTPVWYGRYAQVWSLRAIP